MAENLLNPENLNLRQETYCWKAKNIYPDTKNLNPKTWNIKWDLKTQSLKLMKQITFELQIYHKKYKT